MLNPKTTNLIEQNLKELRLDSQYNLDSLGRFKIYESLGSSRLLEPNYPTPEAAAVELTKLSFADYTIAWLAVLTTEHVLSIWDQVNFDRVPQSKDDPIIAPQHILQMAKDVLQHLIDYDLAFETFHNIFYYSSSRFESYINYNVYCVYQSAYSSLEQILFGRNIERENYDAKDKIKLEGDFVTEAMLAYSLIDNNEPGYWKLFYNNLSLLTGLEIDIHKRQKFWEWWLTEAIPQAWELAEQSSAS